MVTSSPVFRDLTCTGCGAPGLEAAGERVVCSFCGRQYAGSRSFCVNCQHVNREHAAFCEHCGDPMTRNCPACGEHNWIGAEYCADCGRPLDILEYLYQRHKYSTAEWLNRAREDARRLKAEEETAADRRSRQLWKDEHRRERARAEETTRQYARDRAAVLIFLGGVLVISLALLIAGYYLGWR
jgi:hypothetical protein